MLASCIGFNPDYSENAPTLEQLTAQKGRVLIEFGAPWCGHCQLASHVVEQAFNEHVDLLHIKIYDGKGKTLGRVFKVKLWPTLILLHDGQEIKRIVRPTDTEAVVQLLKD